MNLRKESLKSHACWDSNPELCDTSAGLEKNQHFFYCDHCWKRKANKVTRLKDHDYNTGKTSITISIPLTNIYSSCLTLLAG